MGLGNENGSVRSSCVDGILYPSTGTSMDAIQEACRCLQSEKITDRSKGRKIVDTIRSSNPSLLTKEAWLVLNTSIIDCECKEIATGKKKRLRILDDECAQFVRRTVTFALARNIVNKSCCLNLFRHSLEILYSDAEIVSSDYKRLHKDILASLLSCVLVIQFPSKVFSGVFNFLKEDIVSAKDLRDQGSLKLLQTFCRSLYSDESRVGGIVFEVFGWIDSVALPIAEANMERQVSISWCLTECVCSLISVGSVCDIISRVDVVVKIFFLAVKSFLSLHSRVKESALLSVVLTFILDAQEKYHYSIETLFDSKWNKLVEDVRENLLSDEHLLLIYNSDNAARIGKQLSSSHFRNVLRCSDVTVRLCIISQHIKNGRSNCHDVTAEIFECFASRIVQGNIYKSANSVLQQSKALENEVQRQTVLVAHLCNLLQMCMSRLNTMPPQSAQKDSDLCQFDIGLFTNVFSNMLQLPLRAQFDGLRSSYLQLLHTSIQFCSSLPTDENSFSRMLKENLRNIVEHILSPKYFGHFSHRLGDLQSFHRILQLVISSRLFDGAKEMLICNELWKALLTSEAIAAETGHCLPVVFGILHAITGNTAAEFNFSMVRSSLHARIEAAVREEASPMAYENLEPESDQSFRNTPTCQAISVFNLFIILQLEKSLPIVGMMNSLEGIQASISLLFPSNRAGVSGNGNVRGKIGLNSLLARYNHVESDQEGFAASHREVNTLPVRSPCARLSVEEVKYCKEVIKRLQSKIGSKLDEKTGLLNNNVISASIFVNHAVVCFVCYLQALSAEASTDMIDYFCQSTLKLVEIVCSHQFEQQFCLAALLGVIRYLLVLIASFGTLSIGTQQQIDALCTTVRGELAKVLRNQFASKRQNQMDSPIRFKRTLNSDQDIDDFEATDVRNSQREVSVQETRPDNVARIMFQLYCWLLCSRGQERPTALLAAVLANVEGTSQFHEYLLHIAYALLDFAFVDDLIGLLTQLYDCVATVEVYIDALALIRLVLQVHSSAMLPEVVTDRQVALRDVCLSFLVGVDGVRASLHSQHWLIRSTQLEILSAVDIFVYKNDERIVNSLKESFIEGFADRDIRVRHMAATCCSFLLQFSSNHDRLLTVVQESMGVGDLVATGYEQALHVEIFLYACVILGGAQRNLARRAFTNICSAFTGNSQVSGIEKQCPIPNWNVVFKKLLVTLASWYSYASIQFFVLDYSFQYFDDFIANEAFPLRSLFVPIVDQNGALMSLSTQPEAVAHWKHTILPLLALVEDNRLRLDRLSEYLEVIGSGRSDGDLVAACAVCSFSFKTSCYLFGAMEKANKFPTSRCNILKSFIGRLSKINFINGGPNDKFSLCCCYLFELTTTLVFGEVEMPAAVISNALLGLCGEYVLGDSVPSIVSSANFIAIVANLRWRWCTTQHPSIKKNIINSVSVIAALASDAGNVLLQSQCLALVDDMSAPSLFASVGGVVGLLRNIAAGLASNSESKFSSDVTTLATEISFVCALIVYLASYTATSPSSSLFDTIAEQAKRESVTLAGYMEELQDVHNLCVAAVPREYAIRMMLPRRLASPSLLSPLASEVGQVSIDSIIELTQSLLLTIERFLRYRLNLHVFVWSQIIAFRECLCRFTAHSEEVGQFSSNLWFLQSEIVAKLISALVEVYEYYVDSKRRIFFGCDCDIIVEHLKNEIVAIIGNFGGSSINSVSPDSLPYRFGNLMLRADGNMVELKTNLCRYVLGSIWDGDSSSASLSVAALDEMFTHQYFQELTKTSENNMNWVHQSIVRHQFGSTYLPLASHSTSISSSNLVAAAQSAEGAPSLWSLEQSVWDTSELEYKQWVCRLVTAICNGCFSCRRINEMIKTLNRFPLAFLRLASVDYRVAEALFPILLWDILLTNGSESKVCDAFALHISKYVLDSNYCKSTKAMQLVCSSFGFIIGQLLQHGQSKDGIGPKRVTNFTTSLGYKIDGKLLVSASLLCKCSSTALYLMELLLDNVSTSLATANGREVGFDLQDIHSILCQIFAEGNDRDSLLGLSPAEPDLLLQAWQFESSGKWMEALASYESIASSAVASSSGRITDELSFRTARGIQNCLTCIGISSALAYESNDFNLPKIDYSADSELRKWNLSQTSASKSNRIPISTIDKIDIIDKYLHNSSKLIIDTASESKHIPIDHCAISTSADATSIIMGCLLSAASQESVKQMMIEITRCQFFVEASEYALLVRGASSTETSTRAAPIAVSASASASSSSRQSTMSPISALVANWTYKQESVNLPDLNFTKDIISTRVDIICQLMSQSPVDAAVGVGLRAVDGCRECTLREAWQLFDSVISCVSSASAAHTLCSTIYKLKDVFLRESSDQRRNDALLLRSIWFLQESRLLWLKGLSEAALSCIEQQVICALQLAATDSGNKDGSSLANASDQFFRDVHSEAMRLRGEWAFSSRSQAGLAVAKDYLLPAASIASSLDQVIKCHHSLIAVNVKLYQDAKARIHSKEFEQAERMAVTREKELDRCKKMLREMREREKTVNSTVRSELVAEYKALSKHVNLLQKETEMDEREREFFKTNVSSYLMEAIRHICIVLKASAEANMEFVLQLVNLWLTNEESADVNQFIGEQLRFIPSFKFIPVLYQLFSRLDDVVTTSNPAQFQAVLLDLLLRVCMEHPHHSFPTLFALSNSNKVELNSIRANCSQGRCNSARSMIVRLKGNASLAALVQSWQLLLTEYVVLAQSSTESFQKEHKTKQIRFRDLASEHNIRPFDECVDKLLVKPMVITLSPRISPLADYGSIVTIVSFASSFSITESGISRPKIIDCLGSDGNWYRQLVKGGDDMRQDAVMEQVFDFVNNIFIRDKDTRQRNLRVRTYKIVPTTPQTGVLEWVSNTIPFGQYLCEKEHGAHRKYRPDDWTHSKCREYMSDASDVDDRSARLATVFEHFKPVFRHFFFEKYANPSCWLARRQTYTRSVAAASVVGYILGIGDRHSHNILVDVQTAELVHIDFGIVFEQGKGLNTPETVPFRLTRDIVDGMGLNQCEGSFRCTCESVMRVLREHSSQILTILEVVMHDPLYKWSLSPQQVRRRQSSHLDTALAQRLQANQAGQGALESSGAATTFGRDAGERAIAKVRSKLQGFEDTSGECLSVKGQVRALISDARSHENLCRLFPGWAAWV